MLDNLEVHLRGLQIKRVNRVTHTKLALPPAQGAEFYFNIYVYDDGEPQITAQPVCDTHRREARDNVAFWGLTFEAPGFRDDTARAATFFATLDALLTHEVRITQHRSWLNYSFTCEYKERDCWLALPGVSVFRWSRSRFVISPKRHLRFHSPPLLVAGEISPNT